MADTPQTQPPGWYYAQGDPPGTQRYWNGAQWEGEPQPVPGAPQEVAHGGLVLAEPQNRIAARVLDGILWIILGVIISAIIVGSSGFDPSSAGDVGYLRGALAGIIATLVVAAYEIYMVANGGATLGKKALGLVVVKADGGGPVELEDAIRRMAPYLGLGLLAAITGPIGIIFNIALLVVGIVSLVFLFNDDRRQAVWDRIAKTVVISTK